MDATLLYVAYFVFAVGHPVSELVKRTSLREFLNLVYYRTGREAFPVTVLSGKLGSLFVLVALVACGILAILGLDIALCFAVGLVAADVLQHFVHWASRSEDRAPKVHSVTIVGVAVPLALLSLQRDLDGSHFWCLVSLVVGAGAIFLNWGRNSWRVRKA